MLVTEFDDLGQNVIAPRTIVTRSFREPFWRECGRDPRIFVESSGSFRVGEAAYEDDNHFAAFFC